MPFERALLLALVAVFLFCASWQEPISGPHRLRRARAKAARPDTLLSKEPRRRAERVGPVPRSARVIGCGGAW